MTKKTKKMRKLKIQVVYGLHSGYVRVWKSYRTHRSSGYGYGSLTELTEYPGMYTNVIPVPVHVLAPRYFYKGIPVARVLCHGRNDLTEVAGMCMNAVQMLQKFRVRV